MIKILTYKHIYLFIAIMLFIQIVILAIFGSPFTPILITVSIINILMYTGLWIITLKNKKAVKHNEEV